MKQICKRLSVIFLALTIISGSVLTTGIVVNADTYKEIFKEDFESYEKKTSGATNKNAMIANGWDVNTNAKGNYNTGSDYCLPYSTQISVGTSNFSGSSNWTNYSVETKMTYVSDSSSSGATYAGISGRLTSTTHNTGYDLIVMKFDPEDAGATLRLRCDGEKLKDVDIETLSNNTQFVLKLEFRDTMIYGYFNNQVMLSYDTVNDTVQYSKGWAGIRKVGTNGMNVVYDDFIVSEIVPGDYPEGYLYYTDFGEDDQEISLEDAGIYGNKDNTIKGGTYNMGAGTYGYLREVVDALYWEDYTVEADIKIVKDATDTATKAYAGIVARSTNGKNEGYEFRMVYNNGNTHVELAKRNGVTDNYGIYDIPFDLNTYYTITMTVRGNNIMCWFGDTLVFDVEDTDDVTYDTGYAGLRSTGNVNNLGVKVDKFAVKQYHAPTVTYPDGYLYCNNFESKLRLKNEGWLKDGAKENGVYILNGGSNNYLTGVENSVEWADYVVEADVMIHDDGTLPQYAGIVGRATDARQNGYELILVREDTGNTVVRLYKRGVSSGKVNDKVNKVNVTWEEGKMNTLKMVLKGADIYCYYNGEIVFEITDNDNPYLTGYAGVISATGTAKSSYDNFAVREIQTTDFPADAVYPEGYLYYNDFSALRALDKEGWRSAGTKTDGTYLLEGGKYNYLTNVEGSAEWTDYVVEADVVLHDNGEVPQYTAIAARSKNLNKEGYELRLIKEEDGDTVVRLYKRGIDSGKINDKVNKINVSVIPNEKHTLKMIVEGATITCYFDGVKMFEVTDKNEPYLTGYAGVHSASGTADSSFEYFAVRQIGATDVVKDAVIQKQDGDIWFFDNFLGEESMTERGWSSDKVAIRNGAALITTRIVADKIQGAEEWTDYEVSAIVYVDKEAGMISETATSGSATVVARSMSSTTGYEFGIISSPSAASYIRLYDRTNGVSLVEDKTTKITSGEHELRMVCIGKEIYCYLDGKLVFAAQSDSATAGYAGVRANNFNTYYRDFIVRKARPVTTTILPSGTVSPATGDNSMNVAVIYVAACIMSLSMIGFVVTTAYNKKRR